MSVVTRLWIPWVVPVLLTVAQPALYAQQQTAPPGGSSPERKVSGQQHLATYLCSSCHGYSGQGSDSGPRLDPSRRTLESFKAYVRKPGGSMPPYRTQAQIPDAALAEIYAFLNALPPPPDPNTIPLLRGE